MTPMNARDGPSSQESRKAEIRVGQTLEVQESPSSSAAPSLRFHAAKRAGRPQKTVDSTWAMGRGVLSVSVRPSPL